MAHRDTALAFEMDNLADFPHVMQQQSSEVYPHLVTKQKSVLKQNKGDQNRKPRLFCEP